MYGGMGRLYSFFNREYNFRLKDRITSKQQEVLEDKGCCFYPVRENSLTGFTAITGFPAEIMTCQKFRLCNEELGAPAIDKKTFP